VVGVVPFGEERARLLWCTARSDAEPSRCDPILDALAWQPWRAGPAVSPGRWPPELAGRPLLVPAGCEVFREYGGGYAGCSRTEWYRWHLDPLPPEPAELVPGAPPAPDQQPAAAASPGAVPPGPSAPAQAAAPARRTIAGPTRPCFVEGIPAACSREDNDATKSVSYRAKVEVRGQTIAVECTFEADDARPPAVCDGFELP
jgi:hypothetical protein